MRPRASVAPGGPRRVAPPGACLASALLSAASLAPPVGAVWVLHRPISLPSFPGSHFSKFHFTAQLAQGRALSQMKIGSSSGGLTLAVAKVAKLTPWLVSQVSCSSGVPPGLANRLLQNPSTENPWAPWLVTYVAVRNLEFDPRGGPIDHPLLSRSFDVLRQRRSVPPRQRPVRASREALVGRA